MNEQTITHDIGVKLNVWKRLTLKMGRSRNMNINRSRRKERSGGTHKVGLRCAAANKLRCDLILKRTYIMTILPAAIFPQSSQSTIHHIALLRSPLYKLPSFNTLREVCKLGMVTFCKGGLPNNRGAQNWSLTRITALDWTGLDWLQMTFPRKPFYCRQLLQ